MQLQHNKRFEPINITAQRHTVHGVGARETCEMAGGPSCRVLGGANQNWNLRTYIEAVYQSNTRNPIRSWEFVLIQSSISMSCSFFKGFLVAQSQNFNIYELSIGLNATPKITLTTKCNCLSGLTNGAHKIYEKLSRFRVQHIDINMMCGEHQSPGQTKKLILTHLWWATSWKHQKVCCSTI